MGMGDKIANKAKDLTGNLKETVGELTGHAQPEQGPGTLAGTMGEAIPLSSWMGDIPDDVLVTALSIPGTHHSGCIDGPLGFAKTQNLGISEQLNAGIRFLDIRLAHYQDDLFVHHDVIYMDKCYKDVLSMCSDFLARHPSEAIIMSIDEEDRVDSSLRDFAPSEVAGRLFRGESESCDNMRSFEDELVAQTREHVVNAPLFYNFAAAAPGGNFGATDATLTSATTLGDVRDRIVFLRRFPGRLGIGFDTTYWLDNSSTRSNEDENGNPRSAVPPIYDVEDHYCDDLESKYDLVVAHIEKARNGDPEDLYITFSSAVTLRASGYSKKVNPRLNDYLAASPEGRVGIVVMDYCEEPPELVSNVIRTNPRSRAGVVLRGVDGPAPEPASAGA